MDHEIKPSFGEVLIKFTGHAMANALIVVLDRTERE